MIKETNYIEKKLNEIVEIKKEAKNKYKKAKGNIKKVISDIKNTGGEFDYLSVEETVTEIFDFITEKESAFSYVTKEIFSYDDYLYNHSINVCIIGSVILNRFNRLSSASKSSSLGSAIYKPFEKSKNKSSAVYSYFPPEELENIAIGFFLHDIGKVLIPDLLLNKQDKFIDDEFNIGKTHSFQKGPYILGKNKLKNEYILNTAKYHHAELYKNEKRCYPSDKLFNEILDYVKICKLADIYDAMTSKKSYKETFNPIGVVTNIFRSYANKNNILQLILHSFIKSIGIHPPGSIVTLKNRQLTYVLDSEGPIILPFTDTYGQTLKTKIDPLNLEDKSLNEKYIVDSDLPIKSITEVYKMMPSYLQKSLIPPKTQLIVMPDKIK